MLRIATGGTDQFTFVALAVKYRLPAIYAQRQYVDAGGLVSYGLSTPDMYYRAATFVDKILNLRISPPYRRLPIAYTSRMPAAKSGS